MDKLLRLNMLNKTILIENVKPEYEYVGGRYLTSMIVNEEVPATCEPLGRHNKLVIAPGLLAGTPAPMTNRTSVGAKSPLTGGIKESNIGGSFAIKMALMGYKGIIIEEKPTEDDNAWYMLYIDAQGAHLKPADEYAGLDLYEACDLLRERFGKHIGIMVVGVGGERQYFSASIAVADDEGIPCRHAGRGGMGAVMGSKRLKCVILDSTDAPDVDYKDRNTFVSNSRDWHRKIIPQRKSLTKYGTAQNVTVHNRLGTLAVRNFSLGSSDEIDKISGERMYDIIVERKGHPSHGCFKGCTVRCSNVYNSPDEKHITSALEFETLILMGSNLSIFDLDAIAHIDRFCDGFGLDTMELGVAFGVAMEAGICKFGDIGGVWKMIGEIKADSVLGKILAQGCVITGKVLGIQKVAAVKGQGMAAYDPRSIKGTGVTYAVSPMGADHTYGNTLPHRPGYRPNTKNPPKNTEKDGQIEWAKDIQIMIAFCDAMGICFLSVGVAWETAERSAELLNLRYGTDFKADDLIKMGKKLVLLEVNFNARAGLSDAHNRMPEYLVETPIPSTGERFDIPESELQRFYHVGFDTSENSV